jgi:nitronate monooxygenase
MWNKTRVTELLNIQYPILQGPFGGGISSARLVAAVSNAGGLGAYGAYQLQPEEITEVVNEIRASTGKPFNINLWVNDIDKESESYKLEDQVLLKKFFQSYFNELGIPFPEQLPVPLSKFEKQAETLLKIKPPVFSFVFGIPSVAILKECKKLGIITIGAITTLDEALVAEAAGVDIILATGFEAGGHRPSFLKPAEDSLVGTFVLVRQVVDKIKKPVIAAGGIADGKGIAAALKLGADAVQVGTAFLACEESNATAIHKQKLFSADAKNTVLSRVFTGRLARGISNSISDELKNNPVKTAPFPLQSYIMTQIKNAAIEQNRHDLVTFWAGQIAPILKHNKASVLFDSLVAETKAILET